MSDADEEAENETEAVKKRWGAAEDVTGGEGHAVSY